MLHLRNLMTDNLKIIPYKVNPMNFVSAYYDLPDPKEKRRIMLCENVHKVHMLEEVSLLEFFVMSYCISGELHIRYDNCEYTIKAGDLLFLFPGHQICSYERTDDFLMTHVMVTPKLAQNLRETYILKSKIVYYNHPVVHLTNDENTYIIKGLSILKSILVNDFLYKDYIVKHFFELSILFINNLEDIKILPERKKSRVEQIFEQFCDLFFANYRQSRKIIWYADKLCITPKYLSSVIKITTGKTAAEWINDCIIMEIKNLLILNKQLEVKEIASSMGFENLSSFCSYFKKHTGTTPMEFRNL